jgi:hypothetical protein
MGAAEAATTAGLSVPKTAIELSCPTSPAYAPRNSPVSTVIATAGAADATKRSTGLVRVSIGVADASVAVVDVLINESPITN